MIEAPEILEVGTTSAAAIRLTIPREEIAQVMGSGIEEVTNAIAEQKIQPTGPWFARYFGMSSATFELEIGVPIEGVVRESGRVRPVELRGVRIARAILTGPYENLPVAWSELTDWVRDHGFTPDRGMMESYVKGPESAADSSEWRTELRMPLQG